METDILKNINEEKSSYENKFIQIVPGLLFNQKQTLEQIYFQHNSKFQSGEIDEDGDKKYFYNINYNPCKVYSKGIDFDTKNIRLLTTESGNPLKTWFMERDFKYWMREVQFGKILNRIFAELPVFGSVVLKNINGEPHFVDLRNFVIEQSADSICDANYVIEKHPYTVAGFRKAAKDMGWDKTKVKETIDLFHQMSGVKHIMVYERYGEVKDDKDNWNFRRMYLADVGVDEQDEQNRNTIPYRGVELKSDILTDEEFELIYWEYHINKKPGRWLGFGVVESLFEVQININESENLLDKTSAFRAAVLFKSSDPAFAGKNLASESRNGDVLDTSAGDINQLTVQDVNLSHFAERYTRWMKNRDELVNAYAPVGTTPTAVQVAQQNFISYFEQIQESIALDVKEMIYEVILPQFEKDSTPEHTLRLVGKDLDTYIEMIKDSLVQEEVVKMVIKGKFPNGQDAQVIGIAIENSLKKNGELLKTLPKDFYKGVKYDIDIDITGESVDTKVRSAAKFAILQAIQSDPTMLQDPTKKKILFSFAEDSGVNMNDIVGVEQKSPIDQMTQLQGSKPGGGGISAPQMQGAPVPGAKTTTL